jgi:hypothetical protein
MDLRARRAFETGLIVTLAGPLAEAAYVAIRRRLPACDDEAAARAMVARGRLPEPTQRLLDDFEAQPPPPTDFEEAQRVARFASTNRSTADFCLAWYAAEVREWVRAEEFRRPLGALALVLYERGELDGREAETIIDAHRRPRPRRQASFRFRLVRERMHEAAIRSLTDHFSGEPR